MLPDTATPTVCFAHSAYRFKPLFDALGTGARSLEARSAAELEAVLATTDVLVVSGLWHNDLLGRAPRLRYIQSISAGVNQFDAAAIAQRGIRLTSAQGVNAKAVSDHAMALILAVFRRLPEARDNQARAVWRGMTGDLAGREDELAGKTLLIIGLGGIGGRLARLARAFDLHVIGVRRDPARGAGEADEVHGLQALPDLLPRADIVALTCPLTEQTRGLIGPDALAAMKPSAVLVNCARGGCVDEPALIAALRSNRLAAAALDVTEVEPLPAASPLWSMPNVLITPHTGGETHRYEANVVAILADNLGRLQRGETALRNQVV